MFSLKIFLRVRLIYIKGWLLTILTKEKLSINTNQTKEMHGKTVWLWPRSFHQPTHPAGRWERLPRGHRFALGCKHQNSRCTPVCKRPSLHQTETVGKGNWPSIRGYLFDTLFWIKFHVDLSPLVWILLIYGGTLEKLISSACSTLYRLW